MRPARALTALALTAAALSTAGCDLGSLGSYRSAAVAGNGTPPAASPTPAAVPAAAPAPAPAPPPTVLRAKAFRKFGTLVVDVRGRPLYRSDRDSARPSVSRCTGACLKTWRPALVTGEFAVVGIDRSLVGTLRLAGGKRQLTLAGRPVYWFTGDDARGEVRGQCKAGFFAITPEGAKTTMRG